MLRYARGLNRVLARIFGVRLVRTGRKKELQRSSRSTPDGLVTRFTLKRIVGWVPLSDESSLTRITLHVNGVPVYETVPYLERTNEMGEPVKEFYIGLSDIWEFLKKSDQISVRADGKILPISGVGDFKNPAENGVKSLEELTRLLSEGHSFSKGGGLKLKKTMDQEWQENIFVLHDQLAEILKETRVIEIFPIYGTLLGLVREGGFIEYDSDVDFAYISKHRYPRAAGGELVDIADQLISTGEFKIGIATSHIAVQSKVNSYFRIDLFHLYFDEDGNLSFPYGIAGDTKFKIEDWGGLEDFEFDGHLVRVPVNSEPLVEHIYGSTWRTPIPGFNWNHARTDRALEATTFKSERHRINALNENDEE